METETQQIKPFWEVIQTPEGITAEVEYNANIQESHAEPLSIKPSIAELERFFAFLNKRFNLQMPSNLIVTIQETKENTNGYFKGHKGFNKIWECLPFKQQDKTPINLITISSHILQDTEQIYETATHEYAHFINHTKGIKDTSKNGRYHNKEFKRQAEQLLLHVEKFGSYGHAFTSTTPQFLEMLKEFKPNANAFKVFQNKGQKTPKTKSRLLLYECACNTKIRTAKNQDKPLFAICQYCNTEFSEVKK